MEQNIRPLTEAERKYTYTQSSQIAGQTCCIGHLRADMGGGKEFYTSWDDHTPRLNDDAFKAEISEVINGLRKRGQMLSSRDRLTKYCYAHLEASFGDNKTWGVRVDTEQYSYLLRLNPNPGEYNLYCYCYVRKWLDRHMSRAEKGVRFVDTGYQERFRIADGDQIRITLPDGESRDSFCRFIDENHVELQYGFFDSDSIYHILEFAERVERSRLTVIPLRASLPKQCYSVLPSTGELILITKGDSGYLPANVKALDCSNREGADQLNRAMGVTKAQEQAMLAGSMFGWHVPAADPKRYDSEGRPMKPRQRQGGEAR